MAEKLKTLTSTENALIDIKGLKVHFPAKRDIFGRTISKVKAVDGIDIEIHRGETLGLVGESGCGRSTTGHAILQLIKPTEGSITLDGTELTTLPAAVSRQRTHP